METSSDIPVEHTEESLKDNEHDIVDIITEDTAGDLVEDGPGDDKVDSTKESDVEKQSSEKLSKPVKHVRLPLSRIKQIMKMDPDIQLVQQDAVFLVSKATELFIEYLAKETNKQLAGIKRKTVMKRDVDVTIESIPQLCFLDGALE